VGVARCYHHVEEYSASLGDGGEGIYSLDPASAGRSVECAVTSEASRSEAVRPTWDRDWSSKLVRIVSEWQPICWILKWPRSRAAVPSTRSSYGVRAAPTRATSCRGSALHYDYYSLGQTRQRVQSRDLARADGKLVNCFCDLEELHGREYSLVCEYLYKGVPGSLESYPAAGAWGPSGERRRYQQRAVVDTLASESLVSATDETRGDALLHVCGTAYGRRDFHYDDCSPVQRGQCPQSRDSAPADRERGDRRDLEADYFFGESEGVYGHERSLALECSCEGVGGDLVDCCAAGAGRLSGELACREWGAWEWMLDGSAEAVASWNGETGHSTPKGCAEDTGVLWCFMC
jgi:hypothetical protein